MLLFLTILTTTSFTLTLAAPGPCPKVKLAIVTEPATLMGTWYQPWMSWPHGQPLPYKCITSTWSNWNVTSGEFDWSDNLIFQNNSQVTVNRTLTRQDNNATYIVTDNQGQSTLQIIDYLPLQNIFWYTCVEHDGGLSHTEIGYVFTRDLEYLDTYWVQTMLAAAKNRLFYLNLVAVPFDNCPGQEPAS